MLPLKQLKLGGNFKMEDMELTHHGIKGMRWGVRRTPAQLGHKTAKKKKTTSVGDSVKEGAKKITTSIKKFKKHQVQKKNAERAREAKKTKEEFEAEKKKAIESGTAADVLKFKGKLTNQELNTAVSRLNMESQLSQLNARTVKTGMDKAEELMGKIDRVKGMAEKGINAWNVYAKIHNSLSPNDLPVIDGNYRDRQEAKREKAQKKAEEKAAKARKKLIESGTPEEIAKNFGKFTVNELKDASSRFGYESKIKELLPKKKAYTAPLAEIVSVNKSDGNNVVSKGRDFIGFEDGTDLLLKFNKKYGRGKTERD